MVANCTAGEWEVMRGLRRVAEDLGVDHLSSIMQRGCVGFPVESSLALAGPLRGAGIPPGGRGASTSVAEGPSLSDDNSRMVGVTPDKVSNIRHRKRKVGYSMADWVRIQIVLDEGEWIRCADNRWMVHYWQDDGRGAWW